MMQGLGNLGMQQASADGMPGTGIEYVVSTPQGQAVLRPLRYPFYDSAIMANAQTQCRILFANHRVFDDGTTPKSLCDTNMTLDSQLGSPNLFDLVGFTGELEYGVSQVDFNDIYNKSTFTWIFGTNTIFTRTTLKKIPQGIGPNGFNSGGTIITQGTPNQNAYFNFTTPDRKARRIDSVEQFRNEVCPCSALSITAAGRKWITYMIGVLYSNI
jgi:hypothetical protein